MKFLTLKWKKYLCLLSQWLWNVWRSHQVWGNKSYSLFEYEKSLSLSCIQTDKQKNLFADKQNIQQMMTSSPYGRSPIKLKVLQSSYFQTIYPDWFKSGCISLSVNNLQTLLRLKYLCLSVFINKKDDRLDSLFDRFKLTLTWRTLLAPTVWSNKARTSVASWRVSATFAEAAGTNSISMIFTPTISPLWGVPRTPMLLLLKCGLYTSKVR